MRERPFLIILCALLLVGSTPKLVLSDGSLAQGKNAARGITQTTHWEGRLASIRRAKARQNLLARQAQQPVRSALPVKKRRSIRRIAATTTALKQGTVQQRSQIPTVIDQEGIKNVHKEIAAEVMQSMPAACQNTLKYFYVRYDNPKSRGLGGASTMILSGNVPDDEFRALFLHEFGHVMDLGCFNGTEASGETEFLDGSKMMYRNDPSVKFYEISWLAAKVQRKETEPQDFVSGYASWDAFEDFAESFTYYALHRSEFQKRADENPVLAAKYQWFETYMPRLPEMAESQHQWSGDVPWDTTKLAYAWKENKE